MFYYFFKNRNGLGQLTYSTDELHAEFQLLVIVGSDTTALALSAFWFYIVRRPTCYAKLVDEIRTTFASLDDIRSRVELSSCTYIQACINEALRITLTGGSELPRVILPDGITIGGQHIPEGV